MLFVVSERKQILIAKVLSLKFCGGGARKRRGSYFGQPHFLLRDRTGWWGWGGGSYVIFWRIDLVWERQTLTEKFVTYFVTNWARLDGGTGQATPKIKPFGGNVLDFYCNSSYCNYAKSNTKAKNNLCLN